MPHVIVAKAHPHSEHVYKTIITSCCMFRMKFAKIIPYFNKRIFLREKNGEPCWIFYIYSNRPTYVILLSIAYCIKQMFLVLGYHCINYYFIKLSSCV